MMSHGGYRSRSSNFEEKSCVKDSLKVGSESSYKDMKQKQNRSSANVSTTERVLKEVGSTSTTFIGPACRPRSSTVKPVKSVKSVKSVKPNLEQTLSDFYKELEKIDSTDGTYAEDTGSVKSGEPLRAPARKGAGTSLGTEGVMTRPWDKHVHQNSTGQKRSPQPHWHQNEPYHPKRQRTNADLASDGAAYSPHPQSHWQHHPPFQSKPYTRFHQTPHRDHPPPFPPVFPGPPQANHRWSCPGETNRYQEGLNFPPIRRFPPPPPPRHFRGFDGDPSCHFDREEGGYDRDGRESNDVNVGWSNNANDGWFQPCKDSDWRPGFRPENEPRAREDRSRPPDDKTFDPSLVLILMRGAPGSGKSSRAQELLSTAPNGLVLSTDDYFCHEGDYYYDPNVLGLAHEWNQNRAKEAMHKGLSPVIIDNTNMQAWEMKPYVKLALERGYNICFQEPDTSWKFNPFELEKRTKHGVPQEKIAQMLDRFSFPISVDIVMSSQEPSHVSARQHPEQQPQRRSDDDPDFH